LAGLALIVVVAATSFFAAAATRVRSLVSILLMAYLAYVGNIGVVTWALSPLHEVTRGGLWVAEGVLLAASVVAWWLRGRPALPLAPARVAAREALTDPVTVLFLVVVAVLLGYEAALASSPPNNMDSLTYHLSRAAAWAQHGGIYWIDHAPEVEMNAYQPFAEQQNLFLMVATGNGHLYALPQYLAQIAILVAVYGSARRLGYGVRPSVCASALLSTFSLVALEAVTAQNDLFSASFPAVAACLLLGSTGIEAAFAGVAVAFGLGTKLTTGLTIPPLAWLAIVRGRRTFVTSLLGGVAGLVAVGMWGYVMNLVHDGNLFGAGTAYVQDRQGPGYPRSVANAFYLAYGLMDTSVLSYHVIHLLAIVGGVVAIVAAAFWIWRGRPRRAAAEEASGLALPFLAALLVLGGAAVIAWGAREWGFPIRGPGGLLAPLEANLNLTYTRIANEDYSAYGPVGIVGLLAAAVLAYWGYFKRRADMRHVVLASALPVFLVLISLESRWVPFLIRYFLLPAVLTAPLLAILLKRRIVALAWFVCAAIAIGFTITADQPKPLTSPYGYGHPWDLTWQHALSENSNNQYADALVEYQTSVPPGACVGVALGTNEPTYLLYGSDLGRHIVYLPGFGGDPLDAARASALSYVVVSNEIPGAVAQQFSDAGWKAQPLSTSPWTLFSVPNAGPGSCLA
jgi:hypothetical protein